MFPFNNSLEIKLKNDLVGKNVRVKEGNAGIFKQLTLLKAGDTYRLRHDLNATYREYILITLPNKKELRMLSSDDFSVWKEISVYEMDGVYNWMGTVPRDPTADPSGNSQSGNPPAADADADAAAAATSHTPATKRGRLLTKLHRLGL